MLNQPQNRRLHGWAVCQKTKRFSKKHIGLRSRYTPCNARFKFNEYLRLHFLEADADQKTCRHKNCLGALWEGSKYCKKHFLSWTPDLLGENETAMKELRSFFVKAASGQWYPESKIMAEVMTRMEPDSKASVPASEVVNIDLEATFSSREVLLIGLADLEGAKVLDCLTKYGEGIIAPPLSPLHCNLVAMGT
ncbi:unnamed protein product [Penicillium discolor]